MKPNSPSTVSCHLVAEFVDDANNFATNEPEFIPVHATRNQGMNVLHARESNKDALQVEWLADPPEVVPSKERPPDA